MAVLLITEGPSAGVKFSLEGHRLLMIGRGTNVSIQIVDPKLSRHHLQIKYVESEKSHHAVDFESRNGVFVNGAKITTPTRLADLDAIQIGDSVLVYSLDDNITAAHIHEAARRLGQGHLDTVGDG